MDRLNNHRGLRLLMWPAAAFYACGAFVHVMNIAGTGGFDQAGLTCIKAGGVECRYPR